MSGRQLDLRAWTWVIFTMRLWRGTARKLEASEYDWFGVPMKRDLLSPTTMDQAFERYANASLSDSAQNMHQTKRMKDIFDQTVWALTEQVRAGAFVPTDFEIRFSELEQSAGIGI